MTSRRGGKENRKTVRSPHTDSAPSRTGEKAISLGLGLLGETLPLRHDDGLVDLGQGHRLGESLEIIFPKPRSESMLDPQRLEETMAEMHQGSPRFLQMAGRSERPSSDEGEAGGTSFRGRRPRVGAWRRR